MKKNIWFLLAFVAILATIISSCSDSISYADRLKTERKQINALFSDDNISIFDFPADSVLQLNTFYQDPKSGIYFRVLDFGDRNNMASKTQPRTNVSYRLDSARFLNESSYWYYDSALGPIERMQYGTTDTYLGDGNYSEYYYLSPAVAVPLAFVGKNGIVDLIVPFNQGSQYQQMNFIPVYIRRLKYTQFE